MMKTNDTQKWEAHISVDLTGINSYGDSTGTGELTYKIHITGTLTQIVGKLESLKEA